MLFVCVLLIATPVVKFTRSILVAAIPQKKIPCTIVPYAGRIKESFPRSVSKLRKRLWRRSFWATMAEARIPIWLRNLWWPQKSSEASCFYFILITRLQKGGEIWARRFSLFVLPWHYPGNARDSTAKLRTLFSTKRPTSWLGNMQLSNLKIKKNIPQHSLACVLTVGALIFKAFSSPLWSGGLYVEIGQFNFSPEQ